MNCQQLQIMYCHGNKETLISHVIIHSPMTGMNIDFAFTFNFQAQCRKLYISSIRIVNESRRESCSLSLESWKIFT